MKEFAKWFWVSLLANNIRVKLRRISYLSPNDYASYCHQFSISLSKDYYQK